MKTYKFSQLIAQSLFLSLVLVGCSGGSDGGSGDGSVNLTELTPEKAEKFAASAASALPGCEYTSDSAIGGSAEFTSTNMLYKNAVTTTVESKEGTKSSSASVIDERVEGNCPENPGYYTYKGSHENGVSTLTYNFVKYCTGDENESVTISGTAYPKSVGEPSDSGPIFQYLQVSSGDMTVIEKSVDGTYTHTLKGKDVKLTDGNGGDTNATQSNPNKLEIGSFNVTDGKSGNGYGVKNVDLSSYPDGENSVTNIKNITYTDLQTGTISIKSSTPLITDADGVIVTGDILVTGSDGTSMTMSPYTSVTNGFGVKVDDEIVGVMDCSGLTQK